MRPSRPNAKNPIFATGNWRHYVLETLLFLAAALIVDALFFGGHRFVDVRPHPFWIIVLLVSVQYGLVAGLFAAVASSCALLIGAMPLREQSADFYRYAASLAGRPTSWLVAATVLGGLRSMHLAKAIDLEAQLDEAKAHASTVADGLDRALAEIQRLEGRIATDGSSRDSLLADLAHAGASNAKTYYDTVAKLARDALGVKDCTILAKTAKGLETAPQSVGGWQSPKSIAPLSGSGRLCELLSQSPRVLSSQDEADRALLPPGAQYLVPIFSARTKTLHGGILIDALNTTDQPNAFITRAAALGYALGSLADTLPPSSTRL